MRNNVDQREEYDGPCCRNVKLDIVVKGDDIVEGSLSEEGDEIAANGKEDKDHIYVQDQSGRTSECCQVYISVALPQSLGTVGSPKPNPTRERTPELLSLS